MSDSILIIDDEKSIRVTLKAALEDEGYIVNEAESGEAGIEFLNSNKPDIVLLDIWMKGIDGIETLKRIKDRWDITVIMMSGHGTIETAVKSTKLGAYDFVEKPLSLEKLLVMIKNAIGARALANQNRALRKQAKKTHIIVGESATMEKIRELIKQVAPTTGSILITGENGTGKEAVAHSIHALSTRYGKPFVEVNCAAIPEELIESELFGHEKGAFTGATEQRRGKFDLANHGTLFLDEIGDMSLKTQAKILRILQEQKFERVGGTQTIQVDVRIVAATNKNLKEEIKHNRFREDLYYRLNVIPFMVPPLRDRKEDIPQLARFFLKGFTETHNKAPREFTEEGLKVLSHYPWPGNVRELKNLIERLVILTTEGESGKPIEAATLFSHLDSETIEMQPSGQYDLGNITGRLIREEGGNLREARQEFEKEFIIQTLKETDGNVSKAATKMGIERSHLHRKIKAFGIEVKHPD